MKLIDDLYETLSYYLSLLKNSKNEKEEEYILYLITLLKNNKPFWKKKGWKKLTKKIDRNDEVLFLIYKNIFAFIFLKKDNYTDIVDLIDCYTGFQKYYNDIDTWDFIFKDEIKWMK